MSSSVQNRDLCDYCQLPLPTPWWSRSHPEQTTQPVAHYCCLGCRVAAQVTQENGETGYSRALLTRMGIAVFLTMNVMVFTMALWSQDVYSFDLGNEATATLTDLFRYICLLFTIPVLFLLGQPLLQNAIESAREGRPSTDLLLSVGILSGFVFSAVTVFRGQGHLYFEVVCMVLVLVTLGRWIEATGRQKANAALDRLERMLPETVKKVVPGGTCNIPRIEVQVGDRLRVFSGERVPIDAEVENGTSRLDVKLLTGESRTVHVSQGGTVYSGALVLDGPLTLRATTNPNEDTLAKMLDFVQKARLAKGRYARLADRVATLFLPLVILIALAAALWHSVFGGLESGLLAGMSVLLVSCPCALGLATPLAIWTAMGWAAERRILFRNGDALERLADIKAVCFDKTGTLTTSQIELAEILTDKAATERYVLTAATALAAHSSHPICHAILKTNSTSQMELRGVTQAAGLGMKGTTIDSGQTFLMGNERWLQENGVTIPREIQRMSEKSNSDALVTHVASDQAFLGTLCFREELRELAGEVIRELGSMGLSLEILSGDRTQRAARLASKWGVPVRGELLPVEKANRIAEIQSETGAVLMVGDGVNDAPALTVADVGLALGCGTDLARESGEICLLGDDLQMIPDLLKLSRLTMSKVRWNLFWAFGYNVVGIAFAASGNLNPVLAAVLMFGSSLFVLSNSLSVKGFDSSSEAKTLDDSSRVDEEFSKPQLAECLTEGRSDEVTKHSEINQSKSFVTVLEAESD